jgi:hypothetical protein
VRVGWARSSSLTTRKLGRRVALKVLPHALAADPERRARFEREARAVAALNHPNIITIHSVEEQDGVLFLTMELVEGKTLTEIIYTSRASGAADWQVWKIDLDGSNPRQIAIDGGIYRGFLRVIGDHVYFKTLEDGWLFNFRVPLGGGPREQLFADPTLLPPALRPPKCLSR